VLSRLAHLEQHGSFEHLSSGAINYAAD
jgi:hypothetical protein